VAGRSSQGEGVTADSLVPAGLVPVLGRLSFLPAVPACLAPTVGKSHARASAMLAHVPDFLTVSHKKSFPECRWRQAATMTLLPRETQSKKTGSPQVCGCSPAATTSGSLLVCLC
jgi:hypothetical protein